MLVPFSGNSAPATMYYQTTRYGALYRGYLGRDYTYPIIWGTGQHFTTYKGTLYRRDLPYPSTREAKGFNTMESSNNTIISLSSSSKKVTKKITINKGAYIPDYYFYNDGRFKGWLTLSSWEDYSDHPKIKGYVCYYVGTVYSGGISPEMRNIQEE